MIIEQFKGAIEIIAPLMDAYKDDIGEERLTAGLSPCALSPGHFQHLAVTTAESSRIFI